MAEEYMAPWLQKMVNDVVRKHPYYWVWNTRVVPVYEQWFWRLTHIKEWAKERNERRLRSE